MKWFKHYTDASRDEALQFLFSKMKHEGWGIWWHLVELIGEKLSSENPSCRLELLKSDWCRLLGIHHRKFSSFLSHVNSMNELYPHKSPIKWGKNKDTLWIEIPNLLKIADNYTRYFKVSEPRKEVEEEEKRKEINPSLPEAAQADSTKDVFRVISLPDGCHNIYMDQINEWDRLFPNVSPAYEVDSLVRWAEKQTAHNSWTPKQRKEWTGKNLGIKLYTSLQYRQKENSGVLAQQTQTPAPEEKKYTRKKPVNFYMYDKKQQEEWERKYAIV
ncbi:hypothetical protein [uncultured Pseudodesulfovibrio sp.]|uniref:hypothetical protein n=1 Tax=uncultured Pseudodesulfovibrio sp. TaxID=2035858 RepID=UPI0029C99716|nr:hypothetical protein [uncultured Pseudodesulfovibrio sp.]